MAGKILQLAEIPGITPDEAGSFEKEVRDELTQSGTYHLPGVGTFSRKNQTVQFEADKTLELEVNAPFAGLKPLLLVKVGTNVVADTDYGYHPEPIPADEGLDEKPDAPIKPAVVAEVQLPVEKPLLNKLAETAPIDRKKSVSRNSPEPISTTPETTKAEQKTSGNRLIFVFAAAGILVAVLLMSRFFIPPTTPEIPVVVKKDSVAVQAQPSPIVANYAEPDSSTLAEKTDSSSSEIPSQTPVFEETTAPVAPRFGLQLPSDTSIIDFYTLVVHSLDTEEKARRQVEILSAKGLRASYLSATVDEKTVFRVGLGQFESVDQAKTAAAELPEPYRSAYFIKRFKPNS